ncbi:MAG: hypothetical protein ABSB78_12770 [Bacteroidota bacterium]
MSRTILNSHSSIRLPPALRSDGRVGGLRASIEATVYNAKNVSICCEGYLDMAEESAD